MALTLNGAGSGAADPILSGLGIEMLYYVSSMDAATNAGAWVDTAAGFPGTNALAGISPATTVLTSGNAGSYDATARQYTISSTAGLQVGDYIYMSGGAGGGSITAGYFKIASIPVAGKVTLTTDPLAAASTNVTGITYQVAWRTTTTVVGTAPLTAGTWAAAQQLYFKAQTTDSVGNTQQIQDFFYAAAPPALSGTTYISIDGKAPDGTQVTRLSAPTLAVLAGAANHGGIATVAMANHSTQARLDFQWADASTGEKTLAYGTTAGNFHVTGADGMKYGRLLFRSLTGSAVSVGADIAIAVDTTAPSMGLALAGR